jgi:hypothetical protein
LASSQQLPLAGGCALKIVFAGDDAVGGLAQVQIGRQDRTVCVPGEDRVVNDLIFRVVA